MAAAARGAPQQVGWIAVLLSALLALVMLAPEQATAAPGAAVASGDERTAHPGGVRVPAVDAPVTAHAAARSPAVLPVTRRRIAGWFSVTGSAPDRDAASVTFECVGLQDHSGPVAMRSARLERGTAEFAFEALPSSPEGHRVTARVRGLADVAVHVAGVDDVVDVHLQAVGWATVEMNVVDGAQQPCPGEQVVLGDVASAATWTARADAAGMVRFAALPPGEFHVGFGSAARGVRGAHTVVVRSPMSLDEVQNVLAVVPARTRLEIQIHDEGGSPVEGADVSLTGEHDPETGRAVSSDRAGVAVFDRLLPGRWRLSVVAPDRHPHVQVLQLRSGTTEPVLVKLPRPSARPRS